MLFWYNDTRSEEDEWAEGGCVCGAVEEMRMRTIIVGDIHGCYAEFEEMLEKTELDEACDRLILIGDVIDRGPDSRLALNRIWELQKRMDGRLVYLMGNHEDLAVEAWETGDRHLWDANGGAKTRRSFYRSGDRFDRYLPYISERPLYYETEDYICAHAAVSARGPEQTERQVFLWDRNVALGMPYGGKFLIYGHTPMKAVTLRDETGRGEAVPVGLLRPLPQTGSICIDTGCVYGHSLSALIIADGMFQVMAVEFGRAKRRKGGRK